MNGYNTEQKKLLIDFFIGHKEESFTIEDVAAALEAKKAPIGKSTIYRLIPRLAEEGTLKKFSTDGRRGNFYQLLACEHRCEHLHMKCVGCGRLFHLSECVSKALLDEVKSSDGFSVDIEKTVLFGKCRDCRCTNNK